MDRQMAVQYGLSVVFGILAVLDCKRKWFWGRELFVSAVLVLAGGFWTETALWNRLAGGAVGLVLLGFAVLSREQFGIGDAVLLLPYGISFGIYYLTALLMLAFGMTAAVGICLLCCRKIRRTTKLPFVPFLFAAQLILCLAVG